MGPRFLRDWPAAVSGLGVKTGRAVARALDRRPLGLPVAALVAGFVMIVAASVLSPETANRPAGEPTSGLGLLVAAALLFGVGGMLVLGGLAGLVSAALVHIMKKRER